MESFADERQRWVVQPLLDAGLEPDQVRALVFHLAFEDIISEGRGTVAAVSALVADRPPEVRAAWLQTITRLTTLDLST